MKRIINYIDCDAIINVTKIAINYFLHIMRSERARIQFCENKYLQSRQITLFTISLQQFRVLCLLSHSLPPSLSLTLSLSPYLSHILPHVAVCDQQSPQSVWTMMWRKLFRTSNYSHIIDITPFRKTATLFVSMESVIIAYESQRTRCSPNTLHYGHM